MGQHNEEIDWQAAEWAAKVAGGALTPDEQAKFESWRAADIRNMGAFARAQAILVRMDRLRAVGADALRAAIPDIQVTGVPAGTVPSEAAAAAPDAGGETPPAAIVQPVVTRRRVVLTGGAAASLAAAGIVGAVLWNGRPRPSVTAPLTYFATRIGETRTVKLTDGSIVKLNTDTKMAVGYTDAVRSIRLDQGEALFKVAKNKKRPFIVTASDTVVRAVGTSFTVRVLPERPVRILVQEGVVEVAYRDMRGSKPVRAVAETQTVVATNAPIAVRTVPRAQVERNLAWQYGQISFENETLADAAAEFARYSETKITVDPAVGNRTITGLFASNDPVGFAKVAASVLDLHVEVEPKEVWIVR